jgi:putative flippase GtrA
MGQMFFYLLNGVLSALIYFLLLNLLISQHLNLSLSISISFALSTIFNFLFNKYLTFRSYKRLLPEVMQYSVMIFASYFLTILCTNFFISYSNFGLNLSSLITIGITAIFRFFYSKLMVFR